MFRNFPQTAQSSLPMFPIRIQGGPITAVLVIFAAAMGNAIAADDDHIVHGQAPPDQAVLSHVRGGAFFVPKDLKHKYDDLLARVRRLKADIAAGNIAGEAALKQLKQLEPEIESLRKEMQAKKVLVSPVKLQRQTEELTFELGPARMLIVTADHLRVIGWDEPKVKCVLEKTLLGTNDKPQTDEFKALHLTHRLGQAPDLIGKTDDVVAAEEKEYRTAHKDVPESQLAPRAQLVKEIQSSHAPYRSYQGQDVDVVGIEGLSGQEGNRQITVDIRSPGGGANMGSDWRRQAMLTVYVPRCHGLLLRGCLVGLNVEGVKAPLIITDDGSLDRDYDGAFQITKLNRPLALYNVPLDRLEQVEGDVKIMATVEYANTGTHYEDGKRTTIIPPPRECVIDKMNGNLTAWFARVNLKIGSVTGVVDVMNETGDTSWVVGDPLLDRAYRVISDTGRIDVKISKSVLGKLPLMALIDRGNRDNQCPSRLSGGHKLHDGRSDRWQPSRLARRDERSERRCQEPTLLFRAASEGASRRRPKGWRRSDQPVWNGECDREGAGTIAVLPAARSRPLQVRGRSPPRRRSGTDLVREHR